MIIIEENIISSKIKFIMEIRKIKITEEELYFLKFGKPNGIEIKRMYQLYKTFYDWKKLKK